MSGTTGYLIDSNSLIDYLIKSLPDSGMSFMNDIVDVVPRLSVITKIEVLGFNAPNEYNKFLSDFIKDARIFDLTNEIVEKTIDIRKKHKIKLPDAIIAATAIYNQLTLVTRNISDFKNVRGLPLVNPHNL